MVVTPIEDGNRIQLPADWTEELKLSGRAALERTAEGILVRPCPAATWDEVFANRVPVGRASPVDRVDDPEPLELTADDLLF